MKLNQREVKHKVKNKFVPSSIQKNTSIYKSVNCWASYLIAEDEDEDEAEASAIKDGGCRA